MQLVLLGPQRFKPTLGEAVRSLEIEGKIATITAGWQEREPDDQELHSHLDGRTINLRLWERAEEIFRRDLELAAAHKERQERLRLLQGAYQVRLLHAMEAVTSLDGMKGDARLLDGEREAAVEAVRQLDAHHLQRVQDIHARFEARWRPGDRPDVGRHREEIGRVLRHVDAVAISGGHVAVLLNRLRLFDVGAQIAERTVFAWSAGAMIASERVILFHDSPPQGAGNAEVLDAGLGLCTGVVPLPHAWRRLEMDDRARLGRLARRFLPSTCVAMEDSARLDWSPEGWNGSPGMKRIQTSGELEEIGSVVVA